MEKFGGYDFFNGWSLNLWRKIDTHCLINVLIIGGYVRWLSVPLLMFNEVTIFVNTYATGEKKKMQMYFWMLKHVCSWNQVVHLICIIYDIELIDIIFQG